MTRFYTNMLLELVEDGMLGKDDVIMACVKYMSEDDVKDMCRANDILDEEDEDYVVEEDEEWTPDNADCNDPGSRHHY